MIDRFLFAIINLNVNRLHSQFVAVIVLHKSIFILLTCFWNFLPDFLISVHILSYTEHVKCE